MLAYIAGSVELIEFCDFDERRYALSGSRGRRRVGRSTGGAP
jgi:hypothetical protein